MKETLNLLPIDIKTKQKKKIDAFLFFCFALGIYLILILTLWIFKSAETARLDSEIRRLTQQKTELQQKVHPVAGAPAVPRDKEILGLIEISPKWSVLISDISILTPEEVWLASIESREEKGVRQMNIKGFSTTQLGVANLISALETSNHFYDIEIVFAQKGEKNIFFELKTKLKWT